MLLIFQLFRFLELISTAGQNKGVEFFTMKGSMKGPEAKMPRMEDILSLPVQDPPCAEFSAAHLNWVHVQGGRQGGDDIALIPFCRVDDFVKGESNNAKCPASFRIESRRKRREGSVRKPRVDGYLEYTLYWCSYGPEDYRDNGSGFGDNTNLKPATGKGSRPGRRHMMRGCLCHFTVKRSYTRPLLALIIYNQRNHVDKSGAPCHGILDQNALGTRAMYAPRISEELRHKIMSMLYVGIPLDTIIQHHAEVVQKHGGPHNRDDFLTRSDVRNMERMLRNSSHELHADDKCSVEIWAQRHNKHVFILQDYSNSEPFILGLQTDWQLQQILHYGHNGLLASHSTSKLKKLKYNLCSLLVFDTSRNAIPVAWVITPSHLVQGINKWVVPLVQKIRTKDPRWRPNAFLMDDPAYEASVREAFQCHVLLCPWHLRRSWVKSLLKNCCNSDTQRDLFKHLGKILYCSRSGPSTSDAVEELTQMHIDQCAFMNYFRSRRLPNIELWVNGVRTLPVVSQEFFAPIESYHLRLKLKIFNLLPASSLQRIDCLVHVLTTEFHSLYWFDQYTSETGYFQNLRDGFGSTNSWYQAMHIPDVDVLLDEENLQLAKVVSQRDRSVVYTIWNPGSEFANCDCTWSKLGNLCKHVIKVALCCKNRQVSRPLLAAQVYRDVLLNLLQNAPEDPLVLEHAILRATRLQQEIKGLEDRSNSGLLQPLPPTSNSQMVDSNSILSFP
ncbi:hypothetical protein ACH5RR_039562 [Cinchona calisaya]|uniref:SWIM-type domain-containing protein n=1 Tax=Cinchona calisaya TaxID=153742 RepID=A0ABD2Y238_9GENT